MRYAKFVIGSMWDEVNARQRAAWERINRTDMARVQLIVRPLSKYEQAQRWLWRIYRETIPYTPFVEKGGR